MEIYDEIKQRNKMIQHAKKEDDIIMQCGTHESHNFPLQYGLLWYDEYEPYHYKIIFTETNLDNALKLLQDKLMFRIQSGIISSYLFFQIQHMDANLASYFIITSSNYPYLAIHLYNRRKKRIHKISGNNVLYNPVYHSLFYLKSYDEFRAYVIKLDKEKLRDMYYDAYGIQNVPHTKIYTKTLYTKTMLVKALLDNKKREFIDNY